MLETPSSVTDLLPNLRDGDTDARNLAVRELQDRCLCRMVGLARAKLWGAPPLGEDEEDVARSAFNYFCEHFRRGKYDSVRDRVSLWRRLGRLIGNKVKAKVRKAMRRPPRGPSGEDPGVTDWGPHWVELWDRVTRALGDPVLALVAQLTYENYRQAEIAALLGCACKTVQRKLDVIRIILDQEFRP
jgi:hypothetical protein